VHGISREELKGHPRFAEIADELLEFIRGSELVIHNADFDVGFLEHELNLMQHLQPLISQHARVLDTLTLARELHPGQRNSLDALCKRYAVDSSRREVHGALIDAELLANVYLVMTGGQTALLLDTEPELVTLDIGPSHARRDDLNLVIVRASAEELAAHRTFLERMRAQGGCVWRE
jgi:DNA polymerase-3 subunit epsilon